MITAKRAAAIQERLGPSWNSPREWTLGVWSIDNPHQGRRVLVSGLSGVTIDSDQNWIHASQSAPGRVPTYEEMVEVARAVWPDGFCYEVHAPASAHINIHPNVLHLWGRLDGKPAMPDFGKFGTI